jgi:hypothetical protein
MNSFIYRLCNRTNCLRGIKMVNRIKVRWIFLALLLSLCSLFATAIATSQEDEDDTRRLWNKQFEVARAKVKSIKQPTKNQANQVKETKMQTAGSLETKSGTQSTEAIEGELIGITVWRLRPPAPNSDQGGARLLVKKAGGSPSQYQLERAEAEALFSEGQRLRISVETPREGTSYLYVIDVRSMPTARWANRR